MKLFQLITISLLFSTQAFAMGDWWGRLKGKLQRTEAGFSGECLDCKSPGTQSAQAIDLNNVSGQGSVAEAMEHFTLFARNNPECLPKGNETKLGLISDLSKGSANNLSYIVEVDAQGGVKILEWFWAAEGRGVGNTIDKDVGIGNDCGSHKSPHGFMKMGSSDYRPDKPNLVDPYTGNTYTSVWPRCEGRNPSFQDNRIYLSGMERGFNDNLGELDVVKNPNNPLLCRGPNGEKIPRYTRIHPVNYDPGPTTEGCKGMKLEMWCKYAPALRGGCAYNYDGSETPAIKALKKKQQQPNPTYLGS